MLFLTTLWIILREKMGHMLPFDTYFDEELKMIQELCVLFYSRLNLSRTCRKIYNILQSFFVTNKTLRIHQNQNIGPLEFRILTKYATNLRILDASGCSWMSDDLIRPVLKNNPKINELNLSGFKNCSSIFKV